MARKKLPMELISNENSRKASFQKRKNSLKKATYELSTLCGIKACVIVYGPKQDGRPSVPETWPTDPDEVRRIINMYKDKSKQRGNKTLDLNEFLNNRLKKVEQGHAKLLRKNYEAVYPTWDERFNDFSEDQLKELIGTLNDKLEAARERIAILMNGNQCLIDDGTAPGTIDCSLHLQSSQSQNQYPNNTQDLLQRSVELEVIDEQQPISFVESLDIQEPNHYSTHQNYDQDLPFDLSPIIDPMTMTMTMNDNNCTQLDGASSSNIQYTPPLMDPFYYYHPMLGTMENMMFNNPLHSMCYCAPTMQSMPPFMQYPTMSGTSTMPPIPPFMQYPTMTGAPTIQPMPPFMQFPTMSGASSQIHASQMNDDSEIGDIQMNKKARN